MSIFPYVYFMVASFHVTDDDRKIALYAGGVTSAFTFAEFSAGIFWGRMSDRIGRKPVLMMGLIGTAISMVIFGMSPNLPVALLARALGGLLNGNIGVLQTTVAELVTDKKHQPRAYSIMPFVWCLGSIIGPAMGGALAQPCENYPSLFPRGSIFDNFPFLLPNLICVAVLLIGITVGILFLEETHAEKRHQHDWGLEVGRWLLALISGSKCTEGYECLSQSPSDGSGPAYQAINDTTYGQTWSDVESNEKAHPPSGFSVAFTRRVIIVIISYGVLAYHSVSFDQLMPIFLSSPKPEAKPVFPFSFTGGLALTTKQVGCMLAVQGAYSMIAQLWLFPFVARYFGTARVYRYALMIWPAIYIAVPYVIMLPVKLRITAAYGALIGKITLHVIAFPANAILLANAAPSKTLLGSINGVAASVASLARAFGPTITGFVHSKGLKIGCSGISWWTCGIVCLVGAIESSWIEDDEVQKQSLESEKTNDGVSCEEEVETNEGTKRQLLNMTT
ncbi:hypothetical protein KEM54_001258 [Ascosphaera aggregata]|nr:hypothetical protein KEM54_001258 [Ascosphaera aggregata]